MELPSLAAVLAWVGALLADCLRAWCKNRILRATGIEPPAPEAPEPPEAPGAPELPADPAPNARPANDPEPTEPESLTRLLQRTVARFRRGEHS